MRKFSATAQLNMGAAACGMAAAVAGATAPFAAVPAGIAAAVLAFMAWLKSDQAAAAEKVLTAAKIREATERADAANADARQAINQLDMFKHATRRTLTREQIDLLSAAVGYAAGKIVISAEGSEPIAFGRLLCESFANAGWDVRAIPGVCPFIPNIEPGLTLLFGSDPQRATMLCQDIESATLVTCRIMRTEADMGEAKYVLVVGEHDRPSMY